MSIKPFKFKEFTIQQDKTAMKVGTDGVLLGAWVNIKNGISSALDIGTGTGLIALQIAQRSDLETIDALEIESEAFEQAVMNFENSDWADRLYCYHASLQEFDKEIDEKYDLIVSNPPFYKNSFKTPIIKRATARHTDTLSFEELLSISSNLLSSTGSCAFIIPFYEEDQFLELAQNSNLYPNRICRVKGNVNTAVKRTLVQLSFVNKPIAIDDFAIEIERHIYTDTYKKLVKDFYLNL